MNLLFTFPFSIYFPFFYLLSLFPFTLLVIQNEIIELYSNAIVQKLHVSVIKSNGIIILFDLWLYKVYKWLWSGIDMYSACRWWTIYTGNSLMDVFHANTSCNTLAEMIMNVLNNVGLSIIERWCRQYVRVTKWMSGDY